ncbi:MAG: hypothetical protein IJT19_04480 [Bacteroidaceae bacterium]|nr:hypothetical protein [Bacteroidaceae bacterium]
MKKTYITPNARVVVLHSIHVLAESGIMSDSDRGLRYGGVDVEGDLNPDARQDNNYWGDNYWEE